jgi:hypothetical protein
MSVGSGKHMRRWRNVGAIMGKRFDAESELRKRFGIKRSGLSVKPEQSGHNPSTPEIEPKTETGSITLTLSSHHGATP